MVQVAILCGWLTCPYMEGRKMKKIMFTLCIGIMIVFLGHLDAYAQLSSSGVLQGSPAYSIQSFLQSFPQVYSYQPGSTYYNYGYYSQLLSYVAKPRVYVHGNIDYIRSRVIPSLRIPIYSDEWLTSYGQVMAQPHSYFKVSDFPSYSFSNSFSNWSLKQY